MQQADDRQYALLEHLSEGVVVCGPDTRVLAVNAAACRLFGRGPADIVGKVASEFDWGLAGDGGCLPPAEEHPVLQAIRERVSVQNVPVWTGRDRKGAAARGLLSVFPDVGPEGAVERVVATIVEVPEAPPKDGLFDNERGLAAVFLSSPVGIFAIRVADDLFVDANDALMDLVGLTRAEVIGHEVDEIGVWGGGEGRSRILRELQRHGRINNMEIRYGSERGASGVALISMELVDFSGELCVLAFMIDITDRKAAEEALRESEARFRTLIDGAPDGVLVHSGGRLEFVNKALCRMVGARSADEIIGRDLMDMVAPECRDAVRSGIRQVRATGGVPPFEHEYVRLDGSRIPVEATAVELGERGSGMHLVFLRDTTDRRAAEADRESLHRQLLHSQKMESVGQLAGGVAHDFNNILMVQKGYCEMMKAALRPSDPLAQDLAQIEACTERATSLTKQLLAFSRKQTLQPRLLDLNDVVANLGDMLRRLLGEEVELVITPSPTPESVKADPGQLEQVLVNLAVNSRDAMAGGGRLAIEVSHVRLGRPQGDLDTKFVPGDYAVVSLSDTGCGMDEETQSRAFEPFFTTKPEGKGTGLGLAMVHGIVHQSGGDITVSSTVGQGTTFTIYLPACEEPPAQRDAVAERAVERGKGELILVVEDERALRRLAVSMLEKLGYRAIAAENGGTALMLVEDEGLRPDLVLTDVVMPGMRGGLLAKRLRKTLPDLRVVYMSGYTDDSLGEDEVAGKVHFLQKPFSLAGLSVAVKTALVECGPL